MKKHTDSYIQTPRTTNTLVRIDSILEQRMKEFMLSRRRRHWLDLGE